MDLSPGGKIIHELHPGRRTADILDQRDGIGCRGRPRAGAGQKSCEDDKVKRPLHGCSFEPMTDGTERHALAAAVTDQRKRCPEDRMGIREHGLLLGMTRPLPSIRPGIACCSATARLSAGFVA
jgi:hypothetical protein